MSKNGKKQAAQPRINANQLKKKLPTLNTKAWSERANSAVASNRIIRILIFVLAASFFLQSCLAKDSVLVEIDKDIVLGHIKKARHRAERVLLKEPSNKNINTTLLMLYEHEGNLGASIKQAERCLQLSPTAGGYERLRYLMMVKGDYTKAVEYGKKAIEINNSTNSDIKDKRQYDLRIDLVAALYRAGDSSEALEVLEQASRSKYADYKVFLARGEILLRKGAFREALANFEKACFPGCSSGTTWMYLGATQYIIGELEEAQESFKKTILVQTPFRSIDEKNYLKSAEVGLKLVKQDLSSSAKGHYSKTDCLKLISRLLGKAFDFLLPSWPTKMNLSGQEVKKEKIHEVDEH